MMDADRVYAKLVGLFDNREEPDAMRTAARLILAMAAEIDDEGKIAELTAAAAGAEAKRPDLAAMRVHGYFRSSADYRVRIACNLKGLTPQRLSVHLKNAAHKGQSYAKVNSASLVPALEFKDETLGQSLSIIEYLNVLSPQPDLLPGDAWQQAHIRAFAQAIACDIHPLCNLRVLKALRELGQDEGEVHAWIGRWMSLGFDHLEERAVRWRKRSRYIFSEQPTLAELCLVPQLYNARRFKVDLEPYPVLREIDALCLEHRAFIQAAPGNQPDCDEDQA